MKQLSNPEGDKVKVKVSPDFVQWSDMCSSRSAFTQTQTHMLLFFIYINKLGHSRHLVLTFSFMLSAVLGSTSFTVLNLQQDPATCFVLGLWNSSLISINSFSQRKEEITVLLYFIHLITWLQPLLMVLLLSGNLFGALLKFSHHFLRITPWKSISLLSHVDLQMRLKRPKS